MTRLLKSGCSGNCTAFGLTDPEGSKQYIMITSEAGASIPTEWGEVCLACLYDGDGNELRSVGGETMTISELMAGPVDGIIKGWK